MDVLEDKNFTFFKELIRTDRKIALIGLKGKMINPTRRIVVKNDTWRAVINESFGITKNNKFYLKRVKESEIIFKNNNIYRKDKSGIKKITPFNYSVLLNNNLLLDIKDVYEYYKLDFLFDYQKYLDHKTTISYIKKNKITNFEKYFKLKFKYIPYSYFKKELKDCCWDTLYNINKLLSFSMNPNAVVNLDNSVIMNRINNTTILDLINMCGILNYKINILWSDKRIKVEHDKLVKILTEYKKKFIIYEKFNVNNKFKNILLDEYELIDNNFRLIKESDELKHCVGTSTIYSDRIKNGTGAIYSRLYNKQRYTLELLYVNNKYVVNQFQGYLHNKVPKELMDEIKNIVDSLNEKQNKVDNKIGYEEVQINDNVFELRYNNF